MKLDADEESNEIKSVVTKDTVIKKKKKMMEEKKKELMSWRRNSKC